MIRYGVNNSPRVIEAQVLEIVRGYRSDPTETTLGSRIEAVARLDATAHSRRPRAEDLAALLGVTKRTVERYRAKIRLYTLG